MPDDDETPRPSDHLPDVARIKKLFAEDAEADEGFDLPDVIADNSPETARLLGTMELAGLPQEFVAADPDPLHREPVTAESTARLRAVAAALPGGAVLASRTTPRDVPGAADGPKPWSDATTEEIESWRRGMLEAADYAEGQGEADVAERLRAKAAAGPRGKPAA